MADVEASIARKQADAAIRASVDPTASSTKSFSKQAKELLRADIAASLKGQLGFTEAQKRQKLEEVSGDVARKQATATAQIARAQLGGADTGAGFSLAAGQARDAAAGTAQAVRSVQQQSDAQAAARNEAIRQALERQYERARDDKKAAVGYAYDATKTVYNKMTGGEAAPVPAVDTETISP